MSASLRFKGNQIDNKVVDDQIDISYNPSN